MKQKTINEETLVSLRGGLNGYRMQWCIDASYIYVFEGSDETGWHCKYVITPSGLDDYSSKYMCKI